MDHIEVLTLITAELDIDLLNQYKQYRHQ